MTSLASTPTTEIAPRHVNVTGRVVMFGYERCENDGCVVDCHGVATACGRPACPACGSGGANLTRTAPAGVQAGGGLAHFRCTCGRAWAVAAAAVAATDAHWFDQPLHH